MDYRSSRKTQSFGIILETLGPPKRFLICKRRDSYAYGNILRGKWTTSRELAHHISLLELEERRRIKNYDFRSLWDDYWTDHESPAYSRDYPLLERKYNDADIPSLLDKIPPDPDRKSLWGFPKGRANNNEDHMEAALRECCEETRLDRNYITFKSDIYIKERMMGTDNTWYHITYFSAIYFGPHDQLKDILLGDSRIRSYSFSEEISEIKWVTLEEATQYLDLEKNGHILTLEITLKDRSLDRNEHSYFKRKSAQKYPGSNSKNWGKRYHYAHRSHGNDH